MACQSSSFIRISRLSRVMPALLTRMVTGPNSLPMASTRASTPAPSVTPRTRPAPPPAARRAPTAAAPASLGAVPTTVAPCAANSSAMAAPIPRLAPVTSAISPFSTSDIPVLRNLCVLDADSPVRKSFFPISQRGIEVGGSADGAGVQRFVDALDQASQHLARAAFGEAGDAARRQGLHALGPAHRQVELADQGVADGLHALVHFAVDVLHHRDGRLGPGHARHHIAQAIARTARPRRVRRPP